MTGGGLAERWQSELAVAALRQALVQRIQARGHAEVLTAAADRISADFGSQVAFRLKGALLAKPNEFPIHGEIVISESGQGSVAEVRLTEAMGFGVKAGTRKRYSAAFDNLARYLRVGLETDPQRAPRF
jgi:hypothetical protein